MRKIIFFIHLSILSFSLFCYKDDFYKVEKKYYKFCLKRNNYEFLNNSNFFYNFKSIKQIENIPDFKDFNIDAFEFPLHTTSVSEKKKKLARAILECYTLLAVSQTRYWITYSDWIEDWQFELTWEDQKIRLFTLDANRFDDNEFLTNWTHSLAGAIYYSFPRSNNHNWLESFIFTSVASLYWEYLVEWREVVSVNDNIFTSFGGPNIGEALFQLSDYFSKKSGVINNILAFIFSPVLSLNNWLDRKKRKNSITGYKIPWHEFHFFLGQKKSFEPENGYNYTHLNIGFETEIINVPEYKNVGKINRFVKDIYSSEIFFDINLSSNGVEEYNALAKVALFGYFYQDIKKQSSNSLKGSNLFFGASSAFELFKKKSFSLDNSSLEINSSNQTDGINSPTNFSDKLSVINIIGPTFSYFFCSNDFSLRLRAGAYIDFAMINSFAMNKYSSIYDISGAKSALKNHGYYYALGYTISSDLALYYHNFIFKGKIRYHYFDSIEGLDRHQSNIIDDFDINDSRLVYELSFGFKLHSAPLTFELSLEGINREGIIKDISHTEFRTRLYSRIKFNF
jgi:hypothetical protein